MNDNDIVGNHYALEKAENTISILLNGGTIDDAIINEFNHITKESDIPSSLHSEWDELQVDIESIKEDNVLKDKIFSFYKKLFEMYVKESNK